MEGEDINQGKPTVEEGDGVLIRFIGSTQWKNHYQRNNKSRGQKNLRCFPYCCLGFGHQEGFCGRSVLVELHYKSNAINCENIMAVAEFARSDKKCFKVGDKVPLGEINNHGVSPETDRTSYIEGLRLLDRNNAGSGEHGKRKKNKGSYENIQNESNQSKVYSSTESNILKFEFNRNLKGWHYGFLGSKKTRNVTHVFRVYALEEIPGEKLNDEPLYRVLSVCVSPEWQMYCRRRKPATNKQQAQINQKAAEQILQSAKVVNSKDRTEETTMITNSTINHNNANNGGISGKGNNVLDDILQRKSKRSKRKPNNVVIPTQPFVKRRSHYDVSPHFGKMTLAPIDTKLSAYKDDKRYTDLVAILKQIDLPKTKGENLGLMVQSTERFVRDILTYRNIRREMTLVYGELNPPSKMDILDTNLSKAEKFATFLLTQRDFASKIESLFIDQDHPMTCAPSVLQFLAPFWSEFASIGNNNNYHRTGLTPLKSCYSPYAGNNHSGSCGVLGSPVFSPSTFGKVGFPVYDFIDDSELTTGLFANLPVLTPSSSSSSSSTTFQNLSFQPQAQHPNNSVPPTPNGSTNNNNNNHHQNNNNKRSPLAAYMNQQGFGTRHELQTPKSPFESFRTSPKHANFCFPTPRNKQQFQQQQFQQQDIGTANTSVSDLDAFILDTHHYIPSSPLGGRPKNYIP